MEETDRGRPVPIQPKSKLQLIRQLFSKELSVLRKDSGRKVWVNFSHKKRTFSDQERQSKKLLQVTGVSPLQVETFRFPGQTEATRLQVSTEAREQVDTQLSPCPRTQGWTEGLLPDCMFGVPASEAASFSGGAADGPRLGPWKVVCLLLSVT